MTLASLDALCAAASSTASSVPGVATPQQVVAGYLPYMAQQLVQGWRTTTLIKPLIGLFHGHAGAKAWRRMLSAECHQVANPLTLIEKHAESLPEVASDDAIG